MLNHTIMTRWRALQLAYDILPDDAPRADVEHLARILLREYPMTVTGYEDVLLEVLT